MPEHRRGRIVLAAFVALLAGWMAQGFAGEGEDLPTPPGQAEPWSPPATGLPGFLISATRTLFEQGLADPRGCDYRAIDVRVGEIWGPGAGIARTHGWVLPRMTGRREDFAVCWNGLVYPVAALGEKADLDADLRSLVDSLKAARAKARNAGPGRAFGGFMGGDGAIAEGHAVDVGQPIAIKLCLLLRLGRSDLAESLFAACTVWKPGGARRDLTDYGISYLTLASDWAWFLFDRAAGAHMRGDDRVALADSRLLTAASEQIEARAEAMGFPRDQRRFGSRTSHPYLGFLDQLDALRQDQERRAREPRRGEVPPPGGDATTRIAALIRDLDQIAERQNSQPGWIGLGLAPAVRALIAEGDAAVEPLLVVLESDMRLTRSVAFGRHQERGRTILGVHDAAYEALDGDPADRELRPGSRLHARLRRSRSSPETGRLDPRLLGEEQGGLAGRAVLSHAARRRGHGNPVARGRRRAHPAGQRPGPRDPGSRSAPEEAGRSRRDQGARRSATAAIPASRSCSPCAPWTWSGPVARPGRASRPR